MKKAESLEENRKNNDNYLQKIEIENKACFYIVIVIAFLSTIFFMLELFLVGTKNFVYGAFLCIIVAIWKGYMGVKLNKKIEKIEGVIFGVISIIDIAMYIVIILNNN